jgi:hypothetical protein
VTRLLLAGLLAVSVAAPRVAAYSVLAHEALIDEAWKDHFVPLLLKRFPNATPEELRQAQAYAYGGAIIQDLGYFSFKRKYFSDLTHYVRTGDFILNLIRESTDLNEYAFALGAMAHYAADDHGHRTATNRVVPMMFPKLKEQFGDSVTYEQDRAAHLKVEFSFDVVQVAQGLYAPAAYHSFIGFAVSRPVLDRAFAKTYGLEVSSLLGDEERSIGTYRDDARGLESEEERDHDHATRGCRSTRRQAKVSLQPFTRRVSQAMGSDPRRAGMAGTLRELLDSRRAEDWTLQGASLQTGAACRRKVVHGEFQPRAGSIPELAYS